MRVKRAASTLSAFGVQRSGREGGAGLGLSIALWIAQAHHGRAHQAHRQEPERHVGVDVSGQHLRVDAGLDLRDEVRLHLAGEREPLVHLADAGDRAVHEHQLEVLRMLAAEFVKAPEDRADPIERLLTVRQRMTSLKSSYEPSTTLGLFAALGYVPKTVQDQMLDLLASRATAVMTGRWCLTVIP